MANEKERYYKIFNGLQDEIQHLVLIHRYAEDMFLNNKGNESHAYSMMSQMLDKELHRQIFQLEQLCLEIAD